MNRLPLELLDIVLEKSFLHCILFISLPDHQDKDIVRTLASVDLCWFKRTTRRRFKRKIWQRLKDFYEKNKKLSAIIRNNRNYLLANILPNDELIASQLSLNCITQEQSNFIQRQNSTQDKNAEILYFNRPFNAKRSQNFVQCLRQSEQNMVARIIENGGEVIKVKVKNIGAKSAKTLLLHQAMEEIRNRTRPRSLRTHKINNQLEKEGVRILNSQLHRQTVVIWIWCRSQSALEYIQRLYESNLLKDVIFSFANICSSTSETNQTKLVITDNNQFRKTVVVCLTFANFAKRIDEGKFEKKMRKVQGVAKLRNELYILCQSDPTAPNVILGFEDQHPFTFKWKIETPQIRIIIPKDIISSVKADCLYVPDIYQAGVWKITRGADKQHKIIKWLTADNQIVNLSVISDGLLVVVHKESLTFMIFGSDAKLIRSFPLPTFIEEPFNAVETSIRNFIIFYYVQENWKNSHSPGLMEQNCGICEVTRDGKMVVSQFIPSHERQNLGGYCYLSLGSDDRLLVADLWNDRVILLDSELVWNRLLVPSNEEEETMIRRPNKLCYDKENKQLIVGRYSGQVNVYILNHN